MNAVPTCTATIYAGLKERYDGRLHGLDEVRAVLQAYVDAVGLCVTLTATEYLYTHGSEPGVAVGLINYPRFPANAAIIRAHALEIAGRLLQALGQQRVSVVFPDETIMLSAPGSTEPTRERGPNPSTTAS